MTIAGFAGFRFASGADRGGDRSLRTRVAAPFAKSNIGAGDRKDRGNRWALVGIAILDALAAYLPGWSDRGPSYLGL